MRWYKSTRRSLVGCVLGYCTTRTNTSIHGMHASYINININLLVRLTVEPSLEIRIAAINVCSTKQSFRRLRWDSLEEIHGNQTAMTMNY
jgi:hypothetical protein